MNTYAIDGEDPGDVFLDEEDGADDSIHTFIGHTLLVIGEDSEEDSEEESEEESEVYMVACSPRDATLVATGGKDNKGCLWKIGQEDWAFELQGHGDSVTSVAFSYDGQLVASGCLDGIVQVWDVSSRTLKCRFDGLGGGVAWVRWHPHGHLVLAGFEDNSTVWMWNADDATCLNTFSGHTKSVTCGDFTPDGNTICTGSEDASLRVRTGENVHVVRGHFYHTQGLTCLTITADSSLVLTGSQDGSVRIVYVSTGNVVGSLISHTASVECIGLSSSYPFAATGSFDKKLIIWDLQRSLARCICEHEDGVTCLSWIGGSRFVGTGCMDGRVRIWDSLSGECVKTLRGHSETVQSLAVSADGNRLVSVSSDGTARVFEIHEFH